MAAPSTCAKHTTITCTVHEAGSRLEDSLAAVVTGLATPLSYPPPPLSDCLHHEAGSRLEDSLAAVVADLATKFKAITSDSQLSTFQDCATEALHGESVLLTYIPDSKIS